MGTCFVIQPFDGGVFDKRYEDIIVPAISEAGLESYRVDRDHNVTIPIEDIQNGIRNADVCLADVTLDNPNVWFELGYAIASQKDVVIICSDNSRAKFPFDIQHRSIITYSTGSPRDFDKLKESITARVKAILNKQIKMEYISTNSPIAEMQGLLQHEMVALVSIAQNMETPTDKVGTYYVRQDMSKAGFSAIAVTLAIKGLLDKHFIEIYDDQDYHGNEFKSCFVTDGGMNWLLNNQDKLVMQEKQQQVVNEDPFNEDALPF